MLNLLTLFIITKLYFLLEISFIKLTQVSKILGNRNGLKE